MVVPPSRGGRSRDAARGRRPIHQAAAHQPPRLMTQPHLGCERGLPLQPASGHGALPPRPIPPEERRLEIATRKTRTKEKELSRRVVSCGKDQIKELAGLQQQAYLK